MDFILGKFSAASGVGSENTEGVALPRNGNGYAANDPVVSQQRGGA